MSRGPGFARPGAGPGGRGWGASAPAPRGRAQLPKPKATIRSTSGFSGWLLSERSTYLGAAGVLTDGCVRDTSRIRALKFPTYSAGTNPFDTKYRGKLMLADVPGEICGVRVESGDMVFGDLDGTVIVPRKVLHEVVGKALEKVAAENVVRNEIRAGQPLVDIFARHGIL